MTMTTPTTLTDGILVIDKPAGLTSQQVVSRVKRNLGVKKAGHGGTLDPMATGVLVVGIGKATRLLGYVSGHDKQYQATIRLGQATTTDDAEGEPIGEPTPATSLADERIAEAIAGFTGVISQIPSSVSAIKVDGKRAYALVRAGESVELAAREVKVTRFEVQSRRDAAPFADLDVVVDCSSGTYIRALARDLGRTLGVGGHLTALRRTRVGAFGIGEAQALPGRTDGSAGETMAPPSPLQVIPLADAASRVFPTLVVDAATAKEISFGRPIPAVVPDDPTAVLCAAKLLALYRPEGTRSVPVAVFV
jgi:tRNA pseudouridine55 synthase